MMRSPIFISLKTAFFATVITFFMGIFAARYVRDLKGSRGIVDGIFTLPMVLPPTVVGFFLLMIFGNKGPFAPLYEALDTGLIFSYPATILSAVVVSFPLMYRTALGAFDQVDDNYLFAARTLGFSERKVFWQVLVPTAGPGLLSGIVLAFARALGEFGATIMVAGNIPGKTQTISTAIYSAVQAGNRELAFKWSLVVVFLSFISMIALNILTDRS